VILESLDGLLCQVALMIVWGNKLELYFVQVDGVLEILRAFVVLYVEFGHNAGGPELVNQVWYALIILPPVMFLIGSMRIALLLILVKTMMYWLLRADFFGKRPGWSVKIFWVASSSMSRTRMKMVRSFLVGQSNVLVWLSMASSLLSSVGVVCLVNRTPLGVFLPCPFGVSLESG
jgi:hypothetical protein